MRRSPIVNRRKSKYNRTSQSISRRDIYKMREHASLHCKHYDECLNKLKLSSEEHMPCFECKRFNEDCTMEFTKEISSNMFNNDVTEHPVRMPNRRYQ